VTKDITTSILDINIRKVLQNIFMFSFWTPAAITGATKARHTKADVPSRTDLWDFKFIALAWGIGCMASVLEEELSTEVLTIEYVSGSVSTSGS
jgi:hypothetical protein